jgi:hypothetical protein
MSRIFRFSAAVRPYPGQAAWRFATLPPDVAARVREAAGPRRKGWGSVPVEVGVGSSHWRTSVFPDRHSGSYLLPLKAEIRKRERLLDGDAFEFSLKVV